MSFAERPGNEDHRQDREDVCLHRAGQQIERHQRNRHQQPSKRQDDADHEDAAHDIAEQADQQGERAGDALDEIQRMAIYCLVIALLLLFANPLLK